MLRHLKRVYVQFTPGDPRSVSARDLLQRLSGDRAKKSNPQCKVDFKIDEDAAPGSAFVELTFGDDELRKIALANTSVQEVSRLIEQKGSEMELKAVLKEVWMDHVHECMRSNVQHVHVDACHRCASRFCTFYWLGEFAVPGADQRSITGHAPSAQL